MVVCRGLNIVDWSDCRTKSLHWMHSKSKAKWESYIQNHLYIKAFVSTLSRLYNKIVKNLCKPKEIFKFKCSKVQKSWVTLQRIHLLFAEISSEIFLVEAWCREAILKERKWGKIGWGTVCQKYIKTGLQISGNLSHEWRIQIWFF